MTDTDLVRRDIPGFPEYQADSDGEIWSVRNHNGLGSFRICKQFNGKYYRVNLYQSGLRYRRDVHVLIATAFHGKKPDGAICRHLDGNRNNNRPENLRWGTYKENVHDRIAHGTMGVKLTEAKVKEIIACIADGQVYRDIAKRFGVGMDAISCIARGQTWKHIPRSVMSEAIPDGLHANIEPVPRFRGRCSACGGTLAEGPSQQYVETRLGLMVQDGRLLIQGGRFRHRHCPAGGTEASVSPSGVRWTGD